MKIQKGKFYIGEATGIIVEATKNSDGKFFSGKVISENSFYKVGDKNDFWKTVFFKPYSLNPDSENKGDQIVTSAEKRVVRVKSVPVNEGIQHWVGTEGIVINERQLPMGKLLTVQNQLGQTIEILEKRVEYIDKSTSENPDLLEFDLPKPVSNKIEFIGYIHLNGNDFCGISIEERQSIKVIHGTDAFEVCRGENFFGVNDQVQKIVRRSFRAVKDNGMNFRFAIETILNS